MNSGIRNVCHDPLGLTRVKQDESGIIGWRNKRMNAEVAPDFGKVSGRFKLGYGFVSGGGFQILVCDITSHL